MAGDWMKVEVVTLDKPEIRQIARECSCSQGDAFMAWFRLWSYFDAQTADGIVPYFTMGDADGQARLPGIGQALEKVGWLAFARGSCTIAKWDRHNGQSAKTRALATRRKQYQRANESSP